MKTTTPLPCLAWAVTVLISLAAITRADTTLTYGKVSKDGTKGESQKMLIRGGKMRVDMPDGKNAMIFDSAADKVFILEGESKKYLTMDSAMMKQMMEGINAMRAQLEARLAELPEAQQAQMKAMLSKLGQGMLDGGKVPDVKFEETGRQEKVGEYQANVIEVKEDGVKTVDYYVVNRKDLEIEEAEYNTLQKFQAFLGNMIKSLPGAMKQKMKIQMLMAEGDQLPVRIDRFENQQIKRTDQLTDVSSSKLDPALFEIPADYQKRELPFGPGGLPIQPSGQ